MSGDLALLHKMMVGPEQLQFQNRIENWHLTEPLNGITIYIFRQNSRGEGK